MPGEEADQEASPLLTAASRPSTNFSFETQSSSRQPDLVGESWAPSPAEAAAVPGVRRALYASHFLSTWGQRGWEFAVGLIMLELHPSSLLLVSVFGLLDAGVQVLFGAAIGHWVDKVDRLKAAQRMYLLQNSMVALSACTSLVLLWSGIRAGAVYWACLVTTLVAGSASSLGALGSTLSVEREWTKVLCAGQSDDLACMNAVMKRIDLTCLIASPVLVGLIMTYGGSNPMATATLCLAGYNLLAWLPECALLSHAQQQSPALAAPKQTAAAAADPATGSKQCSASTSSAWQRQLGSWATYFRQPVAPAALALSLLYLTVLSFGTLMTAYLKWQGMLEAELSVYRGLGALSGIAATVTFPPLQRSAGLAATGCLSVWLQLSCVVAATLPSLLAMLGVSISHAAVVYALVAGLVLSRYGLWSFDLAANQLIQESVPGSQLGAVNGVQGSLQSLFQMLAYVAGVIVWQPQRFPLLMAGSCAMVALAAAVFTWFAASRGRRSLDVRIAAVDV